jgi:hypothetical protein
MKKENIFRILMHGSASVIFTVLLPEKRPKIGDIRKPDNTGVIMKFFGSPVMIKSFIFSVYPVTAAPAHETVESSFWSLPGPIFFKALYRYLDATYFTLFISLSSRKIEAAAMKHTASLPGLFLFYTHGR